MRENMKNKKYADLHSTTRSGKGKKKEGMTASEKKKPWGKGMQMKGQIQESKQSQINKYICK